MVVLALFGCDNRSFALDAAGYKDVTTLGVIPNGEREMTLELQKALNEGNKRLYFPPGKYLLGTVSIPSDVSLSFDKGAAVTPNVPSLKEKRLFVLAGDNIDISGPEFLFPKVGDREMGPTEINAIIYGTDIKNVKIRGVRVFRTEKNFAGSNGRLDVLYFKKCQNIDVADCESNYVNALVRVYSSYYIKVRNCRGTYSNHITLAEDGSEWLLHEGNWSDHVLHQCQWWGGDSDARKKNISQKETSYLMVRDVKPGDSKFVVNSAGAYDIQVLGNYAQYGMTLGWGSKGRNVLISNNVARYMKDMAYDSEGGENVVITNNIAIDAKFFGIGTYFWGNNILIANNYILIDGEGPEEYRGNFIRMHSPSDLKLFGNGHVLIANNLCVSKLRQPRGIILEAGRDITITGNKLVNGRIRMNDKSTEVVITNNEILNDLSPAFAAIAASAGTRELIIRNNVIRRTSEEGNAVAEQAAISGVLGMEGTRIIEQNLIKGWKYAVWTGPANNGSGKCLIRNNTIEGDFLKEEGVDSNRMFGDGNLDLRTGKSVEFRLTTDLERQKAPPIKDENADVGDNALLPGNQPLGNVQNR